MESSYIMVKLHLVVDNVTRLQAGRFGVRISVGTYFPLFLKTSKLALGITQPNIQ